MEEKVLEELLKNKVFKKEEFLKTGNFKTLIGEISSSKNEKILQKNLLRTIRILQKETTLGLNYQNPTIWLNYGLNSNNYSGSGSKEGLRSGFGSSILTYRFQSPSDIFHLIKEMLTEIIIYLSENIKELNPLWLKLVNEYDMPQENNYLTQLFGELYLKLMPPEKLQELQIRYKSNNPFDARSEIEKNSLPLDSVITSNLLPLALQLAAEYNVAMKDRRAKEKEPKGKREKEVAEEEEEEDEVPMAGISAVDTRSSFTMTEPIYFENTGDGFGNVVISAPRSKVLSIISRIFTEISSVHHKIEELRNETSELVFAKLNLRILTEKLEELINERRPVPYTVEERGGFMEESFVRVLIEERRKEIVKSMGKKRE